MPTRLQTVPHLLQHPASQLVDPSQTHHNAQLVAVVVSYIVPHLVLYVHPYLFGTLLIGLILVVTL